MLSKTMPVMNIPLLNHKAHDGSRIFAELPQNKLWHEMRDHLQNLDGVSIINFMTDNVTEAWIDFRFRGYSFVVNDQFGEYLFFVDDPNCPEDILKEIIRHCAGY